MHATMESAAIENLTSISVESPDARAARLNITIKPETKSRLDEARTKKGIDINVSQVCDAAIAAELDRCERPGIAGLVARLRVESDRRRGAPYRDGHLEGEQWARDRASWAEICHFAQLTEDDVRLGDKKWVASDGSREWTRLGFLGAFVAPEQDYGFMRPPNQWGAPGYQDAETGWTDDPHLCDQYWRGWLAAVSEVFAAVSKELPPIPGVAPATAPVQAPDSRHVDPEDIPF